MPNLAIAGLALLALAVIVTVACVVVSRVRARILRNEDAAATEVVVHEAVDEAAEVRTSDEIEFRESLRRARLGLFDEPAQPQPLPFSDPTETFNADAATVLADVASNLVFVDVEPEFGRSYSDIPEPTDPWLTDAEVYESGEIAKATIAAISDAEVNIPVRTGAWGSNSYNDFDPKREWLRINAAITDPVVAEVLKQRDPMMAFLLPVDQSEPLPEFVDSVAAWAPRHRLDPGHDIDGDSISWHTGLTQAMRIVRQPALESAERSQ